MAHQLTVPAGTSLVKALSQYFASELTDGLLVLPEAVGSGFIQEYNLGPKLHLLIQQYKLSVDLTLQREPVEQDNNTITFSFRHVIESSSASVSTRLPAVRVSSGQLDQPLFFPAGSQIDTILITVQADVFRSLLNAQPDDPFLQTVLPTDKAYLYEGLISPAMHTIATQLIEARLHPALQPFYLKIKAQELICLFLVVLSQRQTTRPYPLSKTDVAKLFAVRSQLLSVLNQPPNLGSLARESGLSESKLTRLFRQIFGSSPYQYYQSVRINEAARLLREQELTVSEVGYRLGFTNLSHFTRLFAYHMQVNPKQYARQWHESATGLTTTTNRQE